MTICTVTGLACDCQPDDGIPCTGEKTLREGFHAWRRQAIDRGVAIAALEARNAEQFRLMGQYMENAEAAHERIAELEAALRGAKEVIMNHKIWPESYWITERCATQEHIIKTAECPWCSVAALEARCRDSLDALEEIASYRGPDSGMDIIARHMRDAAREAIGYETETKVNQPGDQDGT